VPAIRLTKGKVNKRCQTNSCKIIKVIQVSNKVTNKMGCKTRVKMGMGTISKMIRTNKNQSNNRIIPINRVPNSNTRNVYLSVQ
jgi:hypothetical protein